MLGPLLEELDRTARRRPAAAAFERADGSIALTHGELARRVTDRASALAAAGLGPGDELVFGVRPGPDGMTWLLACFRAGISLTVIDPGTTPDRLQAQCRATGATAVLLDPMVHALSATPIGRALGRLAGVALPSPNRLASRVFVTARSFGPGGRLLRGRGVEESRVRVGGAGAGLGHDGAGPGADGPRLVVFTSGTTSSPRGVVHTAWSIAASVSTVRNLAQLDESSRVVAGAPHFVVPTLLAGGTVVLPHRAARDPAHLARVTRTRSVTHVLLAPHAAVAWAEAHGAPASLRRLFLGSAPLRSAALRRILPRVGSATEVWGVYGLTEMLLVTAVGGEERLAHDERQGDLVGSPVGGAEIRVAGDGEVHVKGPGMALGYLGEPPAEDIATGDIGRWQDGRLVLLGRRKEMLIRRGANVYPSLYEPGLIERLRLADAALVGVPDALGDERAVLFIVPPRGERPAMAVARATRLVREPDGPLDAHARPDAIYAIEALPRAGRSSKVDRAALSRLAAARLGMPELADPLLPVPG